jgi:5-methylcytosine-specific restriction endonuclease McrA
MPIGLKGFQKGHKINLGRKLPPGKLSGKNNPFYGRKHTKKSKEKIRNYRLGRIPWNKNKKEIRLSVLDNIRKAHLGIKPTENTRIKMSISKLGNINCLGHKETLEHRRNIGRAIMKDKNPNWKGGITKLGYLIRSSFKYKEWRLSIFKRDNFTCQKCHLKASGNLEAHHKKSFSLLLQEYNIKTFEEAMNCKELWYLKLGETLCEDCHKLTDNYMAKGKIRKN